MTARTTVTPARTSEPARAVRGVRVVRSWCPVPHGVGRRQSVDGRARAALRQRVRPAWRPRRGAVRRRGGRAWRSQRWGAGCSARPSPALVAIGMLATATAESTTTGQPHCLRAGDQSATTIAPRAARGTSTTTRCTTSTWVGNPVMKVGMSTISSSQSRARCTGVLRRSRRRTCSDVRSRVTTNSSATCEVKAKPARDLAPVHRTAPAWVSGRGRSPAGGEHSAAGDRTRRSARTAAPEHDNGTPPGWRRWAFAAMLRPIAKGRGQDRYNCSCPALAVF